MTTSPVSFMDPDVQRCPFPAHEEAREEGPVYLDKSSGYYFVLGYDEIKEAAGNPTIFSSVTEHLFVMDGPFKEKRDALYKEKGFPPVRTLIITDPPEHNYYRVLVGKVFSPVKVKRMENSITAIVEEVTEDLLKKGSADFYKDVAIKIPSFIIADQLGIPRDMYVQFRKWSDAVVHESNQGNSVEKQLEYANTICELQQYLAGKCEEYRENPAPCLLSDLVHSDVDGRRLTQDELISLSVQVLAAGLDTTTMAMTIIMHRIVQTPGLEEELRNDPDRIPKFIEEMLRLEAPVQGLFRRTTCDTVLGGVQIPAESTVILRFGAGNRDPKKFTDPNTMDKSRRNLSEHIAFGYGAHHCIGHLLARAELKILFTKMLTSMKNIKLKDPVNSVDWLQHFYVYGPTRLEITFERI